MSKTSAGLLMYRLTGGELQVLLVHPGGPFFRNKDAGSWTIPKGLGENGEDLLAAAQREFTEETGLQPKPPFVPLAPVKQKGGKTVHCWAFQGDCDPAKIVSNSFPIEWPPRSGQYRQFPEVDRAEWFSVEEGKRKINPAQAALIHELAIKVPAKAS